jgi:hypothetical protein
MSRPGARCRDCFRSVSNRPANPRIYEAIREARRAHCAHRLNAPGQSSDAVDISRSGCGPCLSPGQTTTCRSADLARRPRPAISDRHAARLVLRSASDSPCRIRGVGVLFLQAVTRPRLSGSVRAVAGRCSGAAVARRPGSCHHRPAAVVRPDLSPGSGRRLVRGRRLRVSRASRSPQRGRGLVAVRKRRSRLRRLDLDDVIAHRPEQVD